MKLVSYRHAGADIMARRAAYLRTGRQIAALKAVLRADRVNGLAKAVVAAAELKLARSAPAAGPTRSSVAPHPYRGGRSARHPSVLFARYPVRSSAMATRWCGGLEEL